MSLQQAREDAIAREARDGGDLLTVSQLAAALEVTPRAIRFYEAKGLITPSRAGSMRVYTRRAQARMKLILRGKRLGFSLREIAEFLDLYDADPSHHTQMKRLLEQVKARRRALEDQHAAITQTLAELDALERQARAVLGPALEA